MSLMWGLMVGNQWKPGTEMSYSQCLTTVGSHQVERVGGDSGTGSYAMLLERDANKKSWKTMQQEHGEDPGEGALAREGQ